MLIYSFFDWTIINLTELGSKLFGNCHGKTGGGWWWYTLTYNFKFSFLFMKYFGIHMNRITVFSRLIRCWKNKLSLLNLLIRTDAVTKEIIPKQTDMNLTYIEFLDCVCSSRLRRLNLNFRRKIKIPTSQITNPRPFFKTLKSTRSEVCERTN